MNADTSELLKSVYSIVRIRELKPPLCSQYPHSALALFPTDVQELKGSLGRERRSWLLRIAKILIPLLFYWFTSSLYFVPTRYIAEDTIGDHPYILHTQNHRYKSRRVSDRPGKCKSPHITAYHLLFHNDQLQWNELLATRALLSFARRDVHSALEYQLLQPGTAVPNAKPTPRHGGNFTIVLFQWRMDLRGPGPLHGGLSLVFFSRDEEGHVLLECRGRHAWEQRGI